MKALVAIGKEKHKHRLFVVGKASAAPIPESGHSQRTTHDLYITLRIGILPSTWLNTTPLVYWIGRFSVSF